MVFPLLPAHRLPRLQLTAAAHIRLKIKRKLLRDGVQQRSTVPEEQARTGGYGTRLIQRIALAQNALHGIEGVADGTGR